MDLQIALLLGQDGLTNGAIYALMALALVLAFAVTRVIFIPQGEFVAYGALTLAALQTGRLPGVLWLLLGAGLFTVALNAMAAVRCSTTEASGARAAWRRWGWSVAGHVGLPLLLWLLLRSVPIAQAPLLVQIAITLLLVVPLGPIVYRLAFQPLAEASVLVLLIVSVAVHVVLVGLGLLLFGAEGSRTPPFSTQRFEMPAALAGISVNAQTLWVIGCSLALMLALYLLFGRTLYGKALRATAMNRLGARLMGIPTALAGRLAFGLCALLGAFSGILIAPITTIYYDTGFLIGLKGFVGAIIGGLVSYPIAAAGALLVGLLEAYASFEASAYKEVIVFTLIIPVLLWRSLSVRHIEEDDE